jgi:chromosome segregation protein
MTDEATDRRGALTPPRLLALRLQGFKSFAERTSVEFGGGISAVVGPNGSGKSNLADALRWALGEQGKALRSRKSEDVIWAGSEKRSAQGMADVTLVIDNADGLLPVEYSVLELGRRLYRSGENEYLLNKQRIRLRDLVDLLDAAHLADNAFLFIGQGMVDQALALRPEERRPLFEEVAGVRRHERRRRRAQDQLAESASNLARVEDILAELRPQARRLAAQAEQQTSRQSTADELAAAILVSAHARWHEASTRMSTVTERRDAARTDADRAMAEMSSAEAGVAALAGALGARATLERQRREAHDAAVTALTAARLADGRLRSDQDATERDRRRLSDERTAAESDAAQARRTMAAPVPSRDLALEGSLTEAERELADALAEIATLRAAHRAQGEELAAVRRAAAARHAELETARQRAADVARRLEDEVARAASALDGRAERERALALAGDRRDAAIAAESSGGARLETARAEAEAAEAARTASETSLAAAATALASASGRRAALEARLADEEGRGIAKAARKVGGRRVDADLAVEPAFRSAVEAALSDAARAYVVRSAAVRGLSGERGSLVIEERAATTASVVAVAASDARERRFRDAVSDAGGGWLVDAVRRDDAGAARRILARAAWVPDLEACLAIQSLLPPGWIVVPKDGSATVGEYAVALGASDAVLERRAELDRLADDVERAEVDLAALRTFSGLAQAKALATRAALEAARADEARATSARRTAEETERVAARDLEAAIREATWADGQAERLREEGARAAAAIASLEAVEGVASPDATSHGGGGPVGAVEAWETRAAELRRRRDRLAEEAGTRDATRRDSEARRARAEATVAAADERIARADRETAGLEARAHDLIEAHERVRAELARATEAGTRTRAALDEIHAADSAERERLAAAERDVVEHRQRLRAADDRLRSTDREELEARLGLEALRESVLVDLAGLGDLGIVQLAAVTGARVDVVPPAVAATDDDSDRGTADASGPESELDGLLDAAATRWAAEAPVEPAPGPGRLAQLRRRFHELGATNPYAVEEYAELRTRLETLETQGSDLHTAIARTRELIAELETMITDQFQTTFRALETAFATRFEQLFGGGFARLSLTDPSDLGATGVEIVARPPGKKPQALAMLSGGERALTAVALLFAMLEVRPVPFCVLDEVDAALDEANIGRFAEALGSLAHQTQFIVITHNRGTIEAADALYGVTVGDDSVSRVISLRLDEAQALAHDRRAELATAG